MFSKSAQTRTAEANSSTASATTGTATAPPYDQATALERLGGDRELLAELVSVYQGDAPRMLKQIGQALSTGNLMTVQQVAHTLHGATSHFSAPKVAETAQALESVAMAGDAEDAQRLLPVLRRSVEALLLALRADFPDNDSETEQPASR